MLKHQNTNILLIFLCISDDKDSSWLSNCTTSLILLSPINYLNCTIFLMWMLECNCGFQNVPSPSLYPHIYERILDKGLKNVLVRPWTFNQGNYLCWVREIYIKLTAQCFFLCVSQWHLMLKFVQSLRINFHSSKHDYTISIDIFY